KRMRFDITISNDRYAAKPNNNEIKQIEYIKKNLSLGEITDNIMNGIVLSANFTTDYTSTIKQHQRTYKNLIGTHFIMLDLDDDIECSLVQLIDKLNLKPSIAYTTYSHQCKNKENRYRLLFFFKEEIINIELFKELYNNIVEVNGLSISDNCGKNCTQAVFGSHSECELINTNIVYSIKQFHLKNINQNRLSNSIKEEKRNNIELESLIQDKEYIADYWKLSYTDLIAKHNEKYYFFQHTPLEQVSDDVPYILLSSNYVEIKRYWIYSTNYDENGEIRNVTTRVKPIRDGDGRKRKLYLNGILRRMMIDSLSFEHLLHCLVNELYFYIDNSKDKIDKKQLFEIANRAYNADLNRYTSLIKKEDKRKFIVNDEYCIKHGLNKKQVRNLSKKLLTYNQIQELYDTSLTDNANIEVFKEFGLKISPKTLQRFRKEMGITKYNKENEHSNSMKKKRESNMEIESPIQADYDKPYFDYQCELLLVEMDEFVNDGFYDLKDSDDIRNMTKGFIRNAKRINPNYDNSELIEMFKQHYSIAS
ncbi:hypothetical protein LJC72_13680, partial [Bacteroides sp. OttesenSCG-928-D19]|nr:hypothetical protein [Bacteroides sp. OttesenSCG-928-D19]